MVNYKREKTFFKLLMQNKTEERIERLVCVDNINCWPKCCAINDVFNVERGLCASTNRSFEVFFEIDLFNVVEFNSTYSVENNSNGKHIGNLDN